MSSSRRATWAATLVLFAAASAASACGECVFDERVSGVVRDQRGAALAGVLIESCSTGSRCTDDPADTGCVRATTDAQGRFTLQIAQCRPAAFQCALRPLRVSRAGCASAVLQPMYGSSPAVITGADATLQCP